MAAWQHGEEREWGGGENGHEGKGDDGMVILTTCSSTLKTRRNPGEEEGCREGGEDTTAAKASFKPKRTFRKGKLALPVLRRRRRNMKTRMK